MKKSLASKKWNQGLELRRNLGSGRRPLIRITLAQHHCPKHWHYYVITILHSHRDMLVQCRRKLDVFYLAWIPGEQSKKVFCHFQSMKNNCLTRNQCSQFSQVYVLLQNKKLLYENNVIQTFWVSSRFTIFFSQNTLSPDLF